MNDAQSLTFEPVPSAVPFFTGDAFVNLIVGCVGSSKTATGLVKIAYEAKRIAASRDGIRRSRVAVIRNTRQMLFDTTIPDFLKWFPDGQAGTFLRTDGKFILRFDDVECEVLFRGLDDSNDVRRLLSLQLTFGVMDEFREIHQDIFEALQGRVGRYPDKVLNGVGCKDDSGKQIDKVWGMSNPPDMDTFWESYLSDPPKNALVVTQPSGLSAEADWTHFLKDGFYENLAEGKSDDYIDVYIHAKFGRSLSGRPVFKAFNREFHVAAEPLQPVLSQNSPIIIGVDAGLTPAAVISQVDYSGRLMVYDAVSSDGMGALRFIREKLKPLLVNKYAGFKAMVVIDPAAKQRAQTNEATVRDIYINEGFSVKLAKTNAIAARLAAVDNYLTRTVDGKPLILFCPEGAKELIHALASKYRYRVKRDGEAEDVPEKSHPFSDLADSLEYICLHADGGGVFGTAVAPARREVKQVAALGWT